MQIGFVKKCFFIVAVCFSSIISAQSTLWLDFEGANDTIKKELYGALMENWGRGVYTGVYVGEASSIPNTDGIRNDVIEAFKEAGITCLDWPGGCFAEKYDWRDGIGPKGERPRGDLNTNYPINSDGFGTAEYFQLCDLLGTVPYITANTTNLSPAGMTAWLNHIDDKTPVLPLIIGIIRVEGGAGGHPYGGIEFHPGGYRQVARNRRKAADRVGRRAQPGNTPASRACPDCSQPSPPASAATATSRSRCNDRRRCDDPNCGSQTSSARVSLMAKAAAAQTPRCAATAKTAAASISTVATPAVW